jgi:CrcB protein
MISHYIAIGLGGAVGAIFRVVMGNVLPTTVLGIPFQILFVNVLGCFMMGFLTAIMALYWSISDNMRYFLVPGLLGGFTTFSAFALEFGLLFEKHGYVLAFLYTTLSFGLSITCFFVGLKIIRIFF